MTITTSDADLLRIAAQADLEFVRVLPVWLGTKWEGAPVVKKDGAEMATLHDLVIVYPVNEPENEARREPVSDESVIDMRKALSADLGKQRNEAGLPSTPSAKKADPLAKALSTRTDVIRAGIVVQPTRPIDRRLAEIRQGRPEPDDVEEGVRCVSTTLMPLKCSYSNERRCFVANVDKPTTAAMAFPDCYPSLEHEQTPVEVLCQFATLHTSIIALMTPPVRRARLPRREDGSDLAFVARSREIRTQQSIAAERNRLDAQSIKTQAQLAREHMRTQERIANRMSGGQPHGPSLMDGLKPEGIRGELDKFKGAGRKPPKGRF